MKKEKKYLYIIIGLFGVIIVTLLVINLWQACIFDTDTEQKRERQKRRKATQYMGSLSQFVYSGGMNATKDNIAFACSWVENRLNVTRNTEYITSSSVINLKRLISEDSIIRMLIKRSFEEAYDLGLITHIYTTDELLLKLQDIMNYAPELVYNNNTNEADPDNTITNPLALLYGPLAMTESGEALSYLPQMNQWWKLYLTEWCQFLSSSDSKYAADSWVNDPIGYEYMRMDDYFIPINGYHSWNDFFTRKLKNPREISEPNNNLVVVSACDGTTWNGEYITSINDRFWIKEQPYDIKTLLNNDIDLINRYVGGILLQTALLPADYHRWHAPVTGTITRAQIVGQTYFTQINYLSKYDTTSQLKFWTGQAPYMTHLNIRSIIEIDTSNQGGLYTHGNIGRVLFIAVGLSDVSSVINTVNVGDVVKKGTSELGKFQYGGSTVLYLFPKNTINSWVITPPISDDPINNPFDPIIHGEHIAQGQHLFNANPQRNYQREL
eukprot:366156_1